jgi:hypothetical protein
MSKAEKLWRESIERLEATILMWEDALAKSTTPYQAAHSRACLEQARATVAMIMAELPENQPGYTPEGGSDG